jgi:hypothetical protein
MSRNINPRPQFLDSAGDPLVSGKMYYFDSGTDIPKVTYADVNLTIPNTHPVILTGDGRLPNVFFDGTSRMKLTDSSDVQLWDIDPVGGENIGGNFEEWNPFIIYSANSIVQGSDGNFYISFTSGNEGNDPTTTPTEWQEIEFVNIWNTNVTYSIGDTVKGSDNLFYVATTEPNQGNDPTSSPANWGPPFDSVTSVETAGLATGGPITSTGTVTVPKAIGTEIDTGTNDTKAVTPKAIADSTILKDADIGVTVEAFDATILKDADIGVTVEAFDATILKDADIGVTVLSPTGDGSGLTGLPAKNRIINGVAPYINQRGPQVGLSSNDYFVDRFQYNAVTTAVVNGDVVAFGGEDWIELDVTTADASVAATDYAVIRQLIEDNNIDDFKLGTASAVTATISFKHCHTKTGTHCLRISNSAGDRVYISEYTQTTTNTEETSTVTIVLDTTGTWLTGTSLGLNVSFVAMCGTNFHGAADTWITSGIATSNQVNDFDNVANFFRIRDVQLEFGDKATTPEYEDYETKLAKCQRYYYRLDVDGAADPFGMAYVRTTSTAYGTIKFPVTMRTTPSALEQSGTANHFRVSHEATTTVCASVPVFISASPDSAQVSFTTSTVLTQGYAVSLESANGAAYLAWSAEL